MAHLEQQRLACDGVGHDHGQASGAVDLLHAVHQRVILRVSREKKGMYKRVPKGQHPRILVAQARGLLHEMQAQVHPGAWSARRHTRPALGTTDPPGSTSPARPACTQWSAKHCINPIKPLIPPIAPTRCPTMLSNTLLATSLCAPLPPPIAAAPTNSGPLTGLNPGPPPPRGMPPCAAAASASGPASSPCAALLPSATAAAAVAEGPRRRVGGAEAGRMGARRGGRRVASGLIDKGGESCVRACTDVRVWAFLK